MDQYSIYLIESKEHWYVGSASGKKSSAAKRLTEHLGGYGGAPKLWAKVQEIGKESFTQTILEIREGDPLEAEQRWYDEYVANDPRKTLNMCRPGTGGMLGRHHSEETKLKIHLAQINRTVEPWTEEHKNNHREVLLGNQHLLGHKHSEETKAKISNAGIGNTHRLGHVMSEEAKAKISMSLIGNTRCLGVMASEESRQKMRDFQLSNQAIECQDCEMHSGAGAMGNHFKASGHRKGEKQSQL